MKSHVCHIIRTYKFCSTFCYYVMWFSLSARAVRIYKRELITLLTSRAVVVKYFYSLTANGRR